MKQCKLLFHGEGNSVKGTGHLIRSFGIASQAVAAAPSQVKVFFSSSNQPLVQQIENEWRAYGFATPTYLQLSASAGKDWPEDREEIYAGLLKLAKDHAFNVLVTDGKYDWTAEEWAQLKKIFGHVLVVDNVKAIGQPVDKVILPVDFFIPNESQKATGQVLTGEDWVWIHPNVLNLKAAPASGAFDYSILMGGADPHNLTLQAMRDIKGRAPLAKNAVVLMGPTFPYEESIRKEATASANIEWQIFRTGKGFHKYIHDSKVLLCAFGLTAMEGLALGCETVLYHHNPTHEAEMRAFLSARQRRALTREEWLRGATIPAGAKELKAGDVGRNLIDYLAANFF